MNPWIPIPPPPILVVLGTRPEAIKLWPVIEELRARELFVQVVSTEQQRDLLGPILKELGIHRDFWYNAEPLPVHLGERLGRYIHWLSDLAAQAALVVVQGDTTTALAGALAAFYNRVPVAHVEAGLRTYDLERPFPEEGNRQMISRVAALNFAPTERAFIQLDREAIPGEVCNVGNTVVDALERIQKRSFGDRVRAGTVFGARGPADVLVTFHRREAWPDATRVAMAIANLVSTRNLRVRWVLHANPELQRVVRETLTQVRGGDRVELVEPLSYTEFIYELSKCNCVITDSGGVIEEATTLGVPMVVVRDATERSEAFGHQGQRAICMLHELDVLDLYVDRVYGAVYGAPRVSSGVFGDGRAAKRIAEKIVAFLETP